MVELKEQIIAKIKARLNNEDSGTTGILELAMTYKTLAEAEYTERSLRENENE